MFANRWSKNEDEYSRNFLYDLFGKFVVNKNSIHLHKFLGFQNNFQMAKIQRSNERTQLGPMDEQWAIEYRIGSHADALSKAEAQNLYRIVVYQMDNEKVANKAKQKKNLSLSFSYLVCRHMHALTTNKSIKLYFGWKGMMTSPNSTETVCVRRIYLIGDLSEFCVLWI